MSKSVTPVFLSQKNEVFSVNNKKHGGNKREVDFRLEASKSLGKVRPDRVKKIARELVIRFPNRFTSDFEINKELVETLTETTSSKLRNRIAGYVTRIVTITHTSKFAEETETEKSSTK